MNLADVYRARGNEVEAERTLRDALTRNPDAAAVHHTLGLSLIRQRRTADALAALGEAQRLERAHQRDHREFRQQHEGDVLQAARQGGV